MTVKPRKLGEQSRARFLVAAFLLAAGVPLVQPPPAFGLSCGGAHEIILDSATISPATGSTATVFTFGLRYRDTANCTPRAVNLRITELGYFPMTQVSGRTFRRGVTYSVSLNLPAGSWTIWFVAASGTGAGDKTVTLKLAKPVVVAPDPTPPSRPPPPGGPPPSVPGDPPPPAPTHAAPTDSPAPGATIGPGGGGVPPGRGGSSGFDFRIPGIFGGPIGGVVGPWMVLTGLGITIFWLLLRHRPESPMGGRAVAASPGRSGIPGSAREEAAIPRWLRPSLQIARATRWRGAPPRSPVRFPRPAPPGVDRREIGYRLVRVADGPDDFRSDEVGRFDRGDQVEVLESRGAFVRVRGADGLEGWVHQAAIVSILD